MGLNALGNFFDHFLDVFLDVFVIMPNHVHGILFLYSSVETKNFLSLQKSSQNHGTRRTIEPIIRGFKIGVTKYRENTYIFQSREREEGLFKLWFQKMRN